MTCRRKTEVHNAALAPRSSVDEEAVPWAQEDDVNANLWHNLEQIDAGHIDKVL